MTSAPPPADQFLADLRNADLGPLRQYGVTPPTATRGPTAATAALGFSAWPWEIAKRGGAYFGQHVSAATQLASAGSKLSGSAAANAVSSGAGNPANTDQVLNSGIFGPAINAIRADQLMRTVLIGWSGGAQVGLFGGDGGGGVVYDVAQPSQKVGGSWGSGGVGIGAQVVTGLALGAFTRPPGGLHSSTAVFDFGVGLAAVGAKVSVIMDLDLNFLGFVLVAGISVGISSSTRYGSISF